MLFSYLSSWDYPHLIIDGVNIKFVPNHKHLGLTLGENMKWKDHIESILTSASRMIGIMRKLKFVFSSVGGGGGGGGSKSNIYYYIC